MIVFENAGKAFRAKKGEINWLFRNVTAAFDDHVSVGILGSAGSGKTTLIDMAAGNADPSEGRVYRKGKISWPFGFRGNLSNRLTGKQNLRFLTDVYGREFTGVLDFVTEFAELGKYIDIPLRRYNQQMRARFAVSAFLAMGFEHYLVDDAMDFGDANFRKKCADYIGRRADQVTFFIATDNPHLVAKYCQVGGVLHDGVLEIYDSVPAAISAFYHSRSA